MLAVDAVREYATLAARCERSFELLSEVGQREGDPARKAACSTAARVIGEYAPRWDALVPESVLLEADRHRAAARHEAAREPSAAAVIEALAAAALRIEAGLSEVCDGAAARLLRAFRADLDYVIGLLAQKR